jgi:hypothetical protein
MIYGWSLLQIIHFVVALQLAHSFLLMLIVKHDCSNAHRRVTLSPSAAVQSIILFANLACIAL